VPPASGANAHILEHGPSLAFPTDCLDALNIVLIDAECEKHCCGACRLLLSAVYYEPWLLTPIVFLDGLSDALDSCPNIPYDTPLEALRGEQGGGGGAGTFSCVAALGIIREGIDRGVVRIRDVQISEVNEG